jgi:signal peptidase I
VPELTAESPSLRGPWSAWWMQRALVALWTGVVPALLAAAVLRYLVPPPGGGLHGMVATLVGSRPVVVWAALFLMFTALARYWRFRIPGGRYASALPAHLAPAELRAERLHDLARAAKIYDQLRSPRVERRISPDLRVEFHGALAELRQALEGGDGVRAAAALQTIAKPGAGALARSRRREALVWVASVGGAVLLAAGLRAAVAQPYLVASDSMMPTFDAGDQVLASKVSYALRAGHVPARGDVVVFQSAGLGLPPTVPDVLLKRVVGLPGDRVAMRGNVPVINGWVVPTCIAGEYADVPRGGSRATVLGRLVVEFLGGATYLTVQPAAMPQTGPELEVPPGQVFVLGDSRGNSVDSRRFAGGRGGGVPLGAVRARAERFLLGTRRDGSADLGRFWRRIDELQSELHADGLQTEPLRAGIARCLAQAPVETEPPPPQPAGHDPGS